MNLLMVEGGWVRKPYTGRFDLVYFLPSKQVCHAAQEGEGDFIYMYETTFDDLDLLKRQNFDVVALIQKVNLASKARASSLAPASQGAANLKDVVVVAVEKVASKEAGAEKVPARPSQADPPLSAKRKAPTTAEEGAFQKKGKAIA
ncbi:hypothetical protein CR513_54255, partial [Mucuna pruriens]